MDKKTKEKIRLNIPKCGSRNKDNKDNNEYLNFIPNNISSRNDNLSGVEDFRKSTIFINDIETLNESGSFINNLDSFSKNEGFKDSLNLAQSPQELKLESKTIINENEKLAINKAQKIKDELAIKEKENILLKIEIKDLGNNIKSMKNKESSYESKILKLNENIKNLEKESLNVKNKYKLKEKKFLEEIKHLKNEIKNKEKIINILKEKLINKSQLIKNLNDLINEKNIKINELCKKLEKNYHNISKKNIDINTNNSNKNFSFSVQNKENENYNINNYNKKLILYKNSQKNLNINQYLKQFNYIIKPRKKILFPKRENQSSTNIFQLNQEKHCDTYHDQGPPLYSNNNSKKDFQKKLNKNINLKKQLNINNKELIKFRKMRKKINTFENFNNSMRNKIKFKNRNNLHFSNISFHSYSNRVAELTSSPELRDIKKIINSVHINLIRERNQPDAFLRRLNKNNQKFIKTSFAETTHSYSNIERTESGKNNKKIINNSLENIINLGKKNNSFSKNNIGINSDKLFRIKDLNKINKYSK